VKRISFSWMVIVWMKFKCERWFVVELPLLRQHFLQFSSVIARVLLGAQIIGKLFFWLSAAHHMGLDGLHRLEEAGDLAERAHPRSRRCIATSRALPVTPKAA
jgi:hypothetical protein